MTTAPNDSKCGHQMKVDRFIRDALAESNLSARAKLLGKAVYWNLMAMKANPAVTNLRGKQGSPRSSSQPNH
jgi:hypothetical protein